MAGGLEKRFRWPEEGPCEEALILGLSGEFDSVFIADIGARTETLIASGVTRIALDLSRVTFIHSEGLGYLIRTRAQIEERGGELVLIAPNRFVRKILSTAGVEELFRIVESDEEAIALFHGRAEVASLDLDTLPGIADDEVVRGAILFRLLDDEDAEAPAGNAIHRIGRIIDLNGYGPVFRWRIPSPGEEAAETGITTETFGRVMHVGTRLGIGFRLPFAQGPRFVRAEAEVTEVLRSRHRRCGEEATIRLVCTSMTPSDREALEAFVAGRDAARDGLGGARP